MRMNGEDLMELSADDRISYVRGSIPDYETRINNALDNVVEEGSSIQYLHKCFRMRVQDNIASPGIYWSGFGLDHLAQGMPCGLLPDSKLSDRDQEYFRQSGRSFTQLTEEQYSKIEERWNSWEFRNEEKSVLTKREYNQLQASAVGLAASMLIELGYQKQAEPAVKLYGKLRVQLDF